jgi:hypothetical protein
VLAGCHLAIGIRRTDGIEPAEPQQRPGDNINLPANEHAPTKPVAARTLELEGGHHGCVVAFGVLTVGGEGEGFVVKDFVVDL